MFFIALLQIACSSDDESANRINEPEIHALEVGANNNRIAYIGSDLHIEAEVFAEHLIKSVKVKIENPNESDFWPFTQDFTEFSGQRNALFHKHIDIASDAQPGIYRFHFAVVDMLGNETEEIINIELKLIEDDVFPTISILNAPSNNQVFEMNDWVRISGNASDNNSLSSILVALVKTEYGLPDEQISESNPDLIVMKTMVDLQPADFVDFNAEIQIGAAQDNSLNPKPIHWENGSYYILVVAKDLNSNKTYSEHYEIIIN